MFLEKIALTNFKNYEELSVQFCEQVNCILGNNGEGKTNLLDAIYYLAFTKSAINSLDNQNIRHESSLAAINGILHKSDYEVKLTCALQHRKKKLFKIDGNEIEKFSNHIGEVPLVFISPDDTYIIRESSEVRRKFIDSTISQLDKVYLDNLIQYNHILKQRNNLLKSWPKEKAPDLDLFESFDVKLMKSGKEIHNSRKAFVEEFSPFFQSHYKYISSEKEKVDILYESQLSDEGFEKKYKEALSKDLILQRTTMGVHKDDLTFQMNQTPIRKFGSQGQQKSFAISLRLGQFDLLKEKSGFTPILLLDDIFDKLDDLRIEKFVALINEETFGQVFITDARPERSLGIFKDYGDKVKFFHIEGGNAKEIQG